MRGDQFTRQWRLLALLLEHHGGIAVEDISKALDVSIRTTYRDLEVLDRAGVPLVQEREGRVVRWRLSNPRWMGLGVEFTADEVLALTRAREAADARGDGELAHQLDRIRSKMRSTLTGAARRRADGRHQAVAD